MGLAEIGLAMGELIERLRLHTQTSMLAEIGTKYHSLPTIEVPSSVNLPELIQRAGENADAAGTILQTDGSPVAVLFNTKQYEAIKGIINFIPDVIQKLGAEFENRMTLKKLGSEVLNELRYPLTSATALMVMGTVIAMAGAFTFGAVLFSEDDKALQAPGNPSSQPKNPWSKRLVNCIIPGLIMAVGMGFIVRSMMITNQVSNACATLAGKLYSV